MHPFPQFVAIVGDGKAERPPSVAMSDSFDEEAERKASIQRFLDARKEAWSKICPPDFLATDPKRLAHPASVAVGVNMPKDCVGVLFSGPTGHGKTRSAWLLAGRMFCNRTLTIEVRTGLDLADEILEAYNNGSIASLIQDLKSAGILFIDDLFKGTWKPSVESTIFNVIDHRVAWRKPTIITTNADGTTIKKMLSADMKEPFMRRIGPDYFKAFLFNAKPAAK